MPKKSIDTINKAFAGLSVDEVAKVLNDPIIKEAWKKLTKDARKKLIIDAKVTGVKDVDDLVDAMSAAVAASEEYFEGLKKYRSTVTSMNLAWAEGAAHMKDYLEQAKKSGGQMAVLGAAATYLFKSLKDGVDAIEDSVLSLHRYNIEQETFSRTTRYTVEDIKGLRSELNLTKDDMTDFFEVLRKGNALGLDVSKIKDVFKQLRSVYGSGAMSKMTDFTELLPMAPEMRIKFMADPSSELDAETIQRIIGSGKISKLIELRAAGLFGGKAETSSSAAFENQAQKVKAFAERFKDEFRKHLPHQAILLSGIGKTLTASLVTLIKMTAFASSITTMMAELLRKQGLVGVGNSAMLGGTARMIGAASAGVTTFMAAKSARTAMSGGEGGKGGADMLSMGLGVGAMASMIPKVAWSKLGTALKGLMSVGIKEILKKIGLLITTTALGTIAAFTTAGLASFLAVNQALSYGGASESQHGYVPSMKEQWNARKYLSYSTGKGEEEPFRASLGDVNKVSSVISQHKEDLEASDLYEQVRQMNLSSMGLSSATSNTKGYLEAMNQAKDSITTRAKQETEFYNGQISNYKVTMMMVKKSKPFSFKTDTVYVAAKKAIEIAEHEKRQIIDKAHQDFQSLIDSYSELAEWGAQGKTRMFGLQKGVLGAQSTLETSRMKGGQFNATMGLKAKNVDLARGKLENTDFALSKVKEELSVKNLDFSKRLILEAKETELTQQRVQNVKDLNDALLDISAFDVLTDRLRSFNETLIASTSYITEIDGSYNSLNDLWKQDIENKKTDLEIARKKLQERVNSEQTLDSSESKLMIEDIKQKELEVAKAELDYAKKVRDTKMEEVNVSKNWINEQADFMEEMGGFFGDVLSKRSQAVQKERENISHLEDFLKQSNLTGLERQKAEIELEREKMKVIKDTVGIQKSSYEKFVGLAFGALGDVGFKKGRMESVLTLGKSATEVQNRAGLYTGGGMGLTRNQVSALNATGFDSNGQPRAAGFSPLVTGEALAQRTVSAATKPEMKLGGQIEVSLSDDLRAKVKEWALELTNDAEFGSALVRANGLVTVNNRASVN